MKAKDWLDENEWDNKPIESTKILTLHNVRYFIRRICQTLHE